MPVYTKSKINKELAKPRSAAAATKKEQQPAETLEQKAKRIAYETKNAASNAAFMAAYRAANPLPEIVTGSPYQTANETWRNGQQGTDGLFDHWTSSK
jgi:hypothetical protein